VCAGFVNMVWLGNEWSEVKQSVVPCGIYISSGETPNFRPSQGRKTKDTHKTKTKVWLNCVTEKQYPQPAI